MCDETYIELFMRMIDACYANVNTIMRDIDCVDYICDQRHTREHVINEINNAIDARIDCDAS